MLKNNYCGLPAAGFINEARHLSHQENIIMGTTVRITRLDAEVLDLEAMDDDIVNSFDSVLISDATARTIASLFAAHPRGAALTPLATGQDFSYDQVARSAAQLLGTEETYQRDENIDYLTSLLLWALYQGDNEAYLLDNQ